MNAPLVVVTVGTDHHPFDRLMDWIEHWAATRAGWARVVVQHGASRAPAGVESLDIVARATMLELMSQATVVVAQSGPGSIRDAHETGHLPLIVPRLSRLGEVVDDHQVAFGRHMAAEGRAYLAQSEDDLHYLLDRVLADPGLVHGELALQDPGPAVAAFEARLEQVMSARCGFVSVRRLVSRRRRAAAARASRTTDPTSPALPSASPTRTNEEPR